MEQKADAFVRKLTGRWFFDIRVARKACRSLLCKALPQGASFAVKAQEILNRADAGGKMKYGCMNNRLWIIRQIVLHSPI